MSKSNAKSKKTGRRFVGKPKPELEPDLLSVKQTEEKQEENEDFEKEMSNLFEDFLNSPPSSPAPLQLEDLRPPSPEMQVLSPVIQQVSAPLTFLPESRLHPNITQRRKSKSYKSIKIMPEEKYISILIIGHGSVIGSEELFFRSKPDCVTKYIVPFGNNAYLSPYTDNRGLDVLGNELDFTDATKEEFKEYMNNLSDTVINNIYDQKTKTTINKEPINYARVKTVNSTLQLNKLYNFYDDDPNDVNDPFNTYGVYILQNNMGIPIKTKIRKKLKPDSSYKEIIRVVTKKYDLDEKSLIYTIDTTCNPVLYQNQKQSVHAPRMLRANAREFDHLIDGINRGDPNAKLITPFIHRILGGAKRQYTRKNKK
jgi:hypothetical protein